MKTKAMAATVYLCRTDVTGPSCPPPTPTPPPPGPILWLNATDGHQSRQLAADTGELLTTAANSPPTPPGGFLTCAIPCILSSAHFNKPPRDVLLPPPHPEEVMKGDWLISGAGALPQAWRADCNNTLFSRRKRPDS